MCGWAHITEQARLYRLAGALIMWPKMTFWGGGAVPTSTSTHKRATTPTPARSWRTARGPHTPFPGVWPRPQARGSFVWRNRRCRRQGARGGRRLSVGGVWVGVMHLRVDRRRLAPRIELTQYVPERCATIAPVRRSTCACELGSRVGVVKRCQLAQEGRGAAVSHAPVSRAALMGHIFGADSLKKQEHHNTL